MKIDQDSFEEWQANPLTEVFMRVVAVLEVQARDAWCSASWEGGAIDPILHAKLRSRASTLSELRHMTAEKIEDILA